MVLKNLFAFGEFDYEIKYSIKKKKTVIKRQKKQAWFTKMKKLIIIKPHLNSQTNSY